MKSFLFRVAVPSAIVLSCLSCGTTPEVDVASEKATIEEVVRASIGWAKTIFLRDMTPQLD